MAFSYKQAVQEIVSAGQRLDARGFAPATAGNYSMRLHSGDVAITVSGAHKGRLTPEQIMRVDLEGKALDEQKPSAETLLHTSLYRIYPEVNAILHTHSIPCTVLTRLMAAENALVLEGYELLKAFPGVESHETRVSLPIFDNTQDMVVLREQVEERLGDKRDVSVYLIRGHGLYGWGKDMAEAERVIEAVEMMLCCELEIKRIKDV